MGNHYTVRGVVKVVGGVEMVGKNATPLSRLVVLEDGSEKYANPLNIDMWGKEAADWASERKEGERVEIDCWVKGREWNGRYFVGLRAFAYEVEAANAEVEAASAPTTTPSTGTIGDSELPF